MSYVMRAIEKDQAWQSGYAAGRAAASIALEAEIARLRRIETAARNLLAPDLDAIGRQYHISSTEPDFLALRAALREEPTTQQRQWRAAAVQGEPDIDKREDPR